MHTSTELTKYHPFLQWLSKSHKITSQSIYVFLALQEKEWDMPAAMFQMLCYPHIYAIYVIKATTNTVSVVYKLNNICITVLELYEIFNIRVYPALQNNK